MVPPRTFPIGGLPGSGALPSGEALSSSGDGALPRMCYIELFGLCIVFGLCPWTLSSIVGRCPVEWLCLVVGLCLLVGLYLIIGFCLALGLCPGAPGAPWGMGALWNRGCLTHR